MKLIGLIEANEDTEAGVMSDTRRLEATRTFNEALVNGRVMVDGEGLHPSSQRARVRFSGDKRTIIDGPFAETKELIGG